MSDEEEKPDPLDAILEHFASPDTEVQFDLDDTDIKVGEELTISRRQEAVVQFNDCHPLDFPAFYQFQYEDEHPELKALRIVYQTKVEQNPELIKIREEYNRINEKYKVFKILSGEKK